MCRNLCVIPPYILCGVRVLVRCPGPLDRLTLWPAEGRDCRTVSCRGKSVFGFLEPGGYRLTFGRPGLCCTLALELPPGANVAVFLDPSEGAWSWRREFFHCFYNQP